MPCLPIIIPDTPPWKQQLTWKHSELQFSEGKVAPPGAKIVYIDGAFDLFHPGHVEILKVRGGRPLSM